MTTNLFDLLKARVGRYRGEGVNHEGASFAATFELSSVLGGRGLRIRFSAKGGDGTVFHEEESTLTKSIDDKLSLFNFNSNCPGMLEHRFATEENGGEKTTLVFRYGDLEKRSTFREEVRIDLFEGGDLGYRYAWGMPEGEFRDRSRVRMRRIGHGFEFSPHIAVQVKDYEKALDFYRNILGMETVHQGKSESELMSGEMHFHVEKSDMGFCHFEFRAWDLADARNRLERAGCELQTIQTPERGESYLVKDPYGLRFHIF